MQTDLESYLPEITVGDRDYFLLWWMLREADHDTASPNAAILKQELERAWLVPSDELPASIVAVGTHLLYREDISGAPRAGTLVLPGILPGSAPYGDGNISLLTLLGVSLLGLSEGQSIRLRASDGHVCSVSVLKVLAQPRRR